MRKKTTSAASVVRKQLQTCCQYETLSLETHDRDDLSEGFKLSQEIHISPPVKDTSHSSFFRRKSFNVTHVKHLLTTPESQTPHRKSLESALPLCAGSKFKPRKLQYVKSLPHLAPASAKATTASMPLPLVLSRLESLKANEKHKSGPLLTVRHSSEGEPMKNNLASPVKLKKYFSGPLLSVQRNPLSGSSSLTAAKTNLISEPLHVDEKTKQQEGPSPTSRFTRMKSSSQALFPAVATSKLSGMVTQGTLKKAAQLTKITPFLDRKGSRGSRASKVDYKPCPSIPMEGNPGSATEKTPLATTVAFSDPRENDGQNAKPTFISTSARKDKSCSERERVLAAVKIQAAFRGHRDRKRYAIELVRAKNPSGETTQNEVEEAPSVSTQISRTKPQKRIAARRARTGMEQVSKSWNGSLRTAQDCQAILKSKQEAALKRERAMEYAMSRQHWKTGSRSQKAPAWIVDNTFPDKPGWVWNWLERAARMGAHNSPNRVFDNDFDKDESVSNSLSVKSTIGICTTEIGSADVDLQCPMTYPWPLSLRQQHAAGLLQPKESLVRPSPLRKAGGGGSPEILLPRHSQQKMTETERAKRQDMSNTDDSCVASQISDELSMTKTSFGVRKLKFDEDENEKQDDYQESVGSCAGPLPALYRLASPFAGPKSRSQNGLQLRKSNPNSLKETIKANLHTYGNSQAHHMQKQVPASHSDSDSAGTTAASVRRPFWRP
ncbi:uncharacterized protein [Physcomitrium patens]|uniref:DUF4005 domain-containing protein n=1 Tax=Physcomitrium patens TaxID=3218 RepID=A0A2K1K7Z0_PHYPA|nr:uncharacterized protein LOC112285786 [Physcomitrium patens]XP_024382698.1 uncharacterized protein LOC112285786 [Physcomitrium patens]PNR49894.1 hypothetical protein PHYPA_011791 [Physcomitrium patens]|eukprot:XP_024382697.1 uncharacterized protein LOC112285786 [Physcomitrella patens]